MVLFFPVVVDFMYRIEEEMSMKRFVFLGLCLLMAGCGGSAVEELKQANEKLNNENRSLKSSLSKAQNQVKRAGEVGNRMVFLVDQIRNVKARIVTNMGTIELKFHPEKAPIHCLTFITRAESGFYNNTKFHRIIKDFMIQGGDPNSKDADPSDDGMGGPLVHIPHEFNDLKHVPGILSTARISDVSAGAGSQFFIMHGTSPRLDNQYTAFGEVTSGMDVVNRIATVETTPRDRPVKPVVIERIDVFR